MFSHYALHLDGSTPLQAAADYEDFKQWQELNRRYRQAMQAEVKGPRKRRLRKRTMRSQLIRFAKNPSRGV